MHGISAGLGKAGAAAGAFLFPVVQKNLGAQGLPVLMGCQFVVCAVGYVVNEIFVPWPVPFHEAFPIMPGLSNDNHSRTQDE